MLGDIMGAEFNQKLFRAADSLRGKMSANQYKDYLLGVNSIQSWRLTNKGLSLKTDLIENNINESII